jgi:hypothetical protein
VAVIFAGIRVIVGIARRVGLPRITRALTAKAATKTIPVVWMNDQTTLIRTGRQAFTSAACSKARNPPICQCRRGDCRRVAICGLQPPLSATADEVMH